MTHSSASMNEHAGVAGSPRRCTCRASHHRRGDGRPVRGGAWAGEAADARAVVPEDVPDGGAVALAEPVVGGDSAVATAVAVPALSDVDDEAAAGRRRCRRAGRRLRRVRGACRCERNDEEPGVRAADHWAEHIERTAHLVRKASSPGLRARAA